MIDGCRGPTAPTGAPPRPRRPGVAWCRPRPDSSKVRGTPPPRSARWPARLASRCRRSRPSSGASPGCSRRASTWPSRVTTSRSLSSSAAGPAQAQAAVSPAQLLTVVSRVIGPAQERSAGLVLAVFEGAASDEGLAELAERAGAPTSRHGHLGGRASSGGPARCAATERQSVDTLWTLMDPAVHVRLVRHRRWSRRRGTNAGSPARPSTCSSPTPPTPRPPPRPTGAARQMTTTSDATTAGPSPADHSATCSSRRTDLDASIALLRRGSRLARRERRTAASRRPG